MPEYNKKYLKNVYGSLAIVGGTFLILEHIWNWGGLTFFDFWGHEWLGFVLLISGILVNVNFKRK